RRAHLHHFRSLRQPPVPAEESTWSGQPVRRASQRTPGNQTSAYATVNATAPNAPDSNGGNPAASPATSSPTSTATANATNAAATRAAPKSQARKSSQNSQAGRITASQPLVWPKSPAPNEA